MIKSLLISLALLCASGVATPTAPAASICTVNVPAITSFCSNVLASTIVPTKTSALLSLVDGELSSYYSCLFGATVTTTSQVCTATVHTTTVVETGSKTTVTITAPVTITEPPKTVTETAQKTTITESEPKTTVTITEAPKTVTESGQKTQTVTISEPASKTVTITEPPQTFTESAQNTQTVTISEPASKTVTITEPVQRTTITEAGTGSIQTVTITEPVQRTTITEPGTGSILTDTITISETAAKTTVTVTASISQSSCTASIPTQSPTTVTIIGNASATTVTVPASTITLSASTVTLSATTVTVTATPTTAALPTGSPTCGPAITPTGTCALAADYNSGTAPQLWAGAAGSFYDCAVLCAGEPGCVSIAYNAFATLQCVLFNSAVSALTLTSDPNSSTFFYDETCFACSGLATAPPTDDGCTPSLEPPPNSLCKFNALYAGGNLFLISAPGTTSTSVGTCEQTCLSTNGCASFAFDGTYCSLYSLSVLQLELQGVVFPVDVGVAGSAEFYDNGCWVCRSISCQRIVTKRELVRRQSSLERREEELNRRILQLLDRERAIEGSH